MKHFITKLIAIVFLLCTASLAQAGRNEALVNYDNVQLVSASGKALSVEETKAILLKVTGRLRWDVRDMGNNQLAASQALVNGKHMMIVMIGYGANTYSVTYRDSYELNYANEGGQAYIHPAYNKAVRLLTDMIRVEAQKY